MNYVDSIKLNKYWSEQVSLKMPNGLETIAQDLPMPNCSAPCDVYQKWWRECLSPSSGKTLGQCLVYYKVHDICQIGCQEKPDRCEKFKDILTNLLMSM